MNEEIEKLTEKLQKHCIENNFKLNPDEKYRNAILTGLIKKKEKYGDYFCPCKLINLEENVCPCDLHEDEIASNGKCTCNLIIASE